MGTKISELPAASALTGAELLPVVQGGSTKRSTITAIGVFFSSSSGSSLIGFIAAGVGAVLRTVQAKLRDEVHIKDFGAVCDGVVDDIAAILAAIAAVPAGTTLKYSGTPLISASIIINKNIKLLGAGGYGNSAANKPGSYFIKKSTMTTAAVRLTAQGASMEGGGVDCQVGNTGDGISVEANGCKLKDTWTNAAGQDGTRVGVNGGNTNSCTLESIRNIGAGRYGIHVSDSGGNANVTYISNPVCISAVQHGIYNDVASETNIFGGTFETNGGYGRYFNNGDSCIVEGGDSEANTTGDLFVGVLTTNLKYDVRSAEIIVDQTRAAGSTIPTTSRSRPYAVWRESELNWPAILTGTTTAAKAVTAITRSSTTATATIVGHGFAANDTFFLLTTTTNNSADHPWGGCYFVATVPDADHITFACSSLLPTPATIGSGISAYVGYPIGSVALGAWRLDGNWCKFSTEIVADTGVKNAALTGDLRLMGLPFRVGSPTMAPVFGSFIANMNVFQLAAFANTNAQSFDFYKTPPLTAGAGAFGLVPVADFAINASSIISLNAAWKIG